MDNKKSGMKAGRPSLYSEALADRICLEIIEGKSLVKICNAKDMPHRATVIRWLGDRPEFATRYARARETQADFMDDLILDVANASTSETAQADRVKIAAYQWRASKLLPKKYGDKRSLEHSGPNGTPIQSVDLTHMSPDDLERLESLFGTLASVTGDDAETDPGREG